LRHYKLIYKEPCLQPYRATPILRLHKTGQFVEGGDTTLASPTPGAHAGSLSAKSLIWVSCKCSRSTYEEPCPQPYRATPILRLHKTGQFVEGGDPTLASPTPGAHAGSFSAKSLIWVLCNRRSIDLRGTLPATLSSEQRQIANLAVAQNWPIR
jgi:hypothetical protein